MSTPSTFTVVCGRVWLVSVCRGRGTYAYFYNTVPMTTCIIILMRDFPLRLTVYVSLPPPTAVRGTSQHPHTTVKVEGVDMF